MSCASPCQVFLPLPKWNSITHWLTLDQLAARKAKVMRATLLYPGDFTPSNPFLPLNFFFIPPFSLKVECSSTSCTKSHLLQTKAASSLNILSLIWALWRLWPTSYILAASLRAEKIVKEKPARIFKVYKSLVSSRKWILSQTSCWKNYRLLLCFKLCFSVNSQFNIWFDFK